MNTNSIKTNERNYSSDYMDNKAFAIIENYVKENNPPVVSRLQERH